jgi:hypothetical protein
MIFLFYFYLINDDAELPQNTKQSKVLFKFCQYWSSQTHFFEYMLLIKHNSWKFKFYEGLNKTGKKILQIKQQENSQFMYGFIVMFFITYLYFPLMESYGQWWQVCICCSSKIQMAWKLPDDKFPTSKNDHLEECFQYARHIFCNPWTPEICQLISVSIFFFFSG